MSLQAKMWNTFTLFTSTQLLIVSSAVLVLLTLSLGVVFGSAVICCYLLASIIWDFELKELLSNLTFPSFYKGDKQQNYSVVEDEVKLVKKAISKSFIHSWTSILELDIDTELKVSNTIDIAIDYLLSHITTKQVDVYDFITDVIYGAHLHIVCYNKARVDPMPRKRAKTPETKLSKDKRFLDLSQIDWIGVHAEDKADYLRRVSLQILHKLLPVEDLSPLALEALSAIISENVFVELIGYLKQQPNLLKLVIRVLSDDYEALLNKAQIPAPNKCEETAAPDTDVVVFSLASADDDCSVQNETDEEAANGNSEDIETAKVDSSESTGTESSNDDEYVSEELMKYFKIDPNSSLVKAANQIAPSSNDDTSSSVLPHSVSTSASNQGSTTPSVLPAMTMVPAMNSRGFQQAPTENISKDTKPKTIPMASLTMAKSSVSQEDKGAVQVQRKPVIRRGSSQEVQSVDSGLSMPPKEELLVKFRSLAIPTTTTRVERHGSNKYTLYVITYQGVYPNESGNGTYVKDCKVFRRYREFISLKARLEKSAQYQSALRNISGPSWWHQVSLNARRAQEVEKRRANLERFIRGLLWQPVVHTSKDLEEFLAYNGGAEIEFVQEKIEFIPQVARIDKIGLLSLRHTLKCPLVTLHRNLVVIKTMSDVFDKVTDKLSSQSHSGSPDTTDKKSKIDDSMDNDNESLTLFSSSERSESDLLFVQEEPELVEVFKSEFSVSKQPELLNKYGNDDTSPSHKLAHALYQILLLLLQNHLDCSKNSRIVKAVGSFLVPYLSHWLRNKVNTYSTPQQLSRLIGLFREALWPVNPEEEKYYDLDMLKKLAMQCVLEEVPSPVTAIMESEIRKLVDDVLEMTECEEINEQLCYTLVAQLLDSSLSMLMENSE